MVLCHQTQSLLTVYFFPGFKSQAMLLSRMFYFVESGKIQEPIYSPDQAPAGTSNKDFLQEYVANLLQNAFKNLQEYVFPHPAVKFVILMHGTAYKSSNLWSGCLPSPMT